MEKVTAKQVANQIFSQMSEEDSRTFYKAEWREGIGHMLVDEWSHLSLDDVLDELDDMASMWGLPDDDD